MAPYGRFSYWTLSKAILELLIQYRHAYRIIIRARSGPSSESIQTFRRFLKYHNAETKGYSKAFAPWKIETYITFNDKSLALRFEQYLKEGSGQAFLKKRLLP